MTEDKPRAYTLGERLDVEARRIATRLLPSLPWAAPLRVLLARAATLSEPFDGRFDRVESAPHGADLGPRTAGHQFPAGATPGPVPTAGPEPPVDGRPVPADVRSRLRDVAGPGADAMRVHHDGAADALARTHHADAVTVGTDVYFRDGRYRPDDERGFGLLAHEATHVLALLRPDAAWNRATGAGARAEEEHALGRERDAVNGRRSPVPPAGFGIGAMAGPAPLAGPTAHPARAAAGPVAAAATPMRADTDRDTTAPAQPPLDLAALRRDLLTDLMRQLRTEFERGG